MNGGLSVADRRDPERAVRERGHGHRLRVGADARDEGTAAGDAVELDLERIPDPPHLDRGAGAVEAGAEELRVARVGLGHVLDPDSRIAGHVGEALDRPVHAPLLGDAQAFADGEGGAADGEEQRDGADHERRGRPVHA